LLGLSATVLEANVIPVPPGAHLDWEFLRFDVDRSGRVQFQGELYFDSIDETVTDMRFPLPPVNAGSIQVRTDGVPQPWRYSTELYPTVLPEYPWLRMFEWTLAPNITDLMLWVDYSHRVFARGDDLGLFYALGTGKLFPPLPDPANYASTDAHIDIVLPPEALLRQVSLDGDVLDSSSYRFSGGRLQLHLSSGDGPFLQDLLVMYRIPVPATLGLLFVGLVSLASRQVWAIEKARVARLSRG
jgi:hypothetical protein